MTVTVTLVGLVSASKTADRFASNPIVIAKAIARAVQARRPAARYVAPRSTNMILWMSAMLPTRMWDWAMRKVAFLTPKNLGMAGSVAVQQPLDAPPPSAKPAEVRATPN